MKRFLRFLRLCLYSLVAITALGGMLFGYFVYTPALALEAPSSFRAVAAVSANLHTPDNFKCKPGPNGTSSVMIMNVTEDPLVPFGGGEVSGPHHIAGAPATNETQMAEGAHVKHVIWHSSGSNVEVELVAVEGGGHGIPQPYRRHPRLLGPSPKEPNGPAVIWAFFERQPKG